MGPFRRGTAWLCQDPESLFCTDSAGTTAPGPAAAATVLTSVESRRLTARRNTPLRGNEFSRQPQAALDSSRARKTESPQKHVVSVSEQIPSSTCGHPGGSRAGALWTLRAPPPDPDHESGCSYLVLSVSLWSAALLGDSFSSRNQGRWHGNDGLECDRGQTAQA